MLCNYLKHIIFQSTHQAAKQHARKEKYSPHARPSSSILVATVEAREAHDGEENPRAVKKVEREPPACTPVELARAARVRL